MSNFPETPCFIVATRTEDRLIKNYFSEFENEEDGKHTLCSMDIEFRNFGERRMILVRTGIGKVNAASGTQMIIDAYNPDLIVNIGVAAAIDSSLKPGDVVVPSTTVEWDLDLNTLYPKTNNEYEILLPDNIKSQPKGSIIATGDTFVADRGLSDSIKNRTGAICLDMEGAAIASVCLRNNTPCIIIKGITDSADGKSPEDLENNFNLAVTNALNVFNSLFPSN